jgi:hypothetical protein
MRFLVLLLAVLGFGAPARADITALYQQVDGARTVRIEIADNGDARFQMSDEAWRLIHRGGVSYAIYTLPGGPLVVRVEDLQRLAAERGGEPPRLAITEMTIVERGETSVGPYSGRAYHLRMPEGLSPRPQFVISRDPALAAIGRAWVRQIDFSIAMLRARGSVVPPTVLRMRDIFRTGTPVLFSGHVLQRVERAPIPAERFRLPAEPLSLEDLRSGAAEALFRPPV